MSEPERDTGIQNLFRRAAEIAKVVPEAMQEAAFHRALDTLLGDSPPSAPTSLPPVRESPPVRGRSRSGAGESAVSYPSAEADAATRLIQDMDRTAHPEVLAASGVRDRSLALLRAAKDQHGIDGLTAKQIALVLRDKFRLPTKDNAVGMAMERSADMVDRVPQGKGYLYRIMTPGERYLDRAQTGEESSRQSRTRTVQRKRTATPAARSRTAPKDEPLSTPTPRKSSGKTGRRGPKSMLELLISEGFFAEAQSISSVIEHLAHTKAMRFKATDISPSLTRLLREGKLTRTRNSQNQYEYRSA